MLTGFWAGFIATLICFIGGAAIIVCNRWIKKITNCYFFWLGISIAILIYFITCRFAGSWREYTQALVSGNKPDGSEYYGAQIISRALLLDFCPFFGFLTPILLIVDPSRKAARSVSPIMLVGSIFVCLGGFLNTPDISLDPHYFFIGDKWWELFIPLHIINLWLALGILCNTPKFEFEGYLIMLGCVLFFVIYVLICKAATGCQTSTSGLSYYDWVPMQDSAGQWHDGTYQPFTNIFGGKPKLAMGLVWPAELVIFSGVVALCDKVFKRFKWHQYGNAKNKKIVKLPTGQKVKQWWFWYDYNKFVEPYRIVWKPIKQISLFWSGKTKQSLSKKQWLNFSWNMIIILSEIIGLVLLFTLPLKLWGIDTQYGGDAFKFYTTDSNILLLISSIIVVVYLLLLNKKKIKAIPLWVKFLKLIATTCATLTMMSVLAFVPFTGLVGFKNPEGLFMNSNIFYHLLCPLLSLVGYLLFEERSKLKIWYTLLCVVPTAIYSIFYLSVALTHIQPGGSIDIKYDWYGLSKFGVSLAPLAVMLALGFSFLFAWCLWYGNKKIYIKQLEK